MRKFFSIIIILFFLGIAFVGFSNWYYHNMTMAPPELAIFDYSEKSEDKSDWKGVIFVAGIIPDIIQVLMANSISPIPTENEISDQQVIENSKTIPEVQAFLAKYPNATNYVDRSGSFLLKYTAQKQYKPDYWNYDDDLSLGLLMYADGDPYRITISCQQDTRKATTQVLKYLQVETCLREPIPTNKKSESMKLCNPSTSIITVRDELNPENKTLVEWKETNRYYMHQKFADELHHRDITLESGCMDIKTGGSEYPSISYSTMCSVVDATDGEKYYLEGTINRLDVGYFYMSNQIHYTCDGNNLGCLCQFDK